MVDEVLFRNSGVGGGVPGDRLDELNRPFPERLREMIDDAADFEQSYLSFQREENQRYYNGDLPALTDDEDDGPQNRSTIVSTDVRDTIMAALPSLMRIFTNTDQKVAEFVPNSEADQDMADQCYDYVNHIFYEANEGFLTLYAVLKDALTVKGGITKWWSDTETEVQERTFRGVTVEQVQFVLAEAPGAEIVESSAIDPMTNTVDFVTIRFTGVKPGTKLEAVPPEEFRISRDAKSIGTARLVGHERLETVGDLIAKGIDPDLLADKISTPSLYSNERYIRNPGLADDRNIRGVLFGEWYVRIDGDGDGIPELRYVQTIGNDYEIVLDEVVPCVRMALWSADPRPHTAVGDSLADFTKDIQKIKTAMVRGQLDNLAESINPRAVVNELVTNLEDVLNDDIGAVIRTRGDPAAAVAYTKTPYAGADVQTSIDYLDRVRASRTGITEASRGLDPKALQSTALVGIDAIVSGAQERIELMARVLAETGLRPTLRGLLQEIVDNPQPERIVKLRGKWVPVNPSRFDASMRVQVNPTLGKGTDQVRAQALMAVKQTQELIIQTFGPANPLVSPVEYRNTLSDILELANIRNPSRYFKEVTPDQIEAINNAPKEPDPATLLAQAELEKVKKDIIVKQGEFDNEQRRLALDEQRAADDAEFRRDKLVVDASLKAAQIEQGQNQFVVNKGIEAAARNEDRGDRLGENDRQAQGRQQDRQDRQNERE